jgi:hypothetical protein
MRMAAAAGAAGTWRRLRPGPGLPSDVRYWSADELHESNAAAGLARRGFGAVDEVFLFLVAVGADEVVEGHGLKLEVRGGFKVESGLGARHPERSEGSSLTPDSSLRSE